MEKGSWPRLHLQQLITRLLNRLVDIARGDCPSLPCVAHCCISMDAVNAHIESSAHEEPGGGKLDPPVSDRQLLSGHKPL